MLFKTGLEKRKAQLERILREFPWLWAVQNRWSPGYHSVVIRTDPLSGESQVFGRLLLEESSESCQWWAKIDLSGLEQVVLVPHLNRASVAQAIVSSFSIGNKIQHLVMRQYDGPFIVFRAARGEDLHKIVCDVAYIYV